MPRRIAAALLFMILKNVVSTRRRKKEAEHLLLLRTKEKEEDEVEKGLNRRDLIPALRTRAPEAPVLRESRSRYAVKNGKPVVLANMGRNANFGMPPTAGSMQKEAARRVMRVRFLTEQARLLLPRRTNPLLDLL